MIHTVQTIKERKTAVCKLAATKALGLPFLSSGFWFHSDIRDNFYYAIHLFAYCVDKEFDCDWNDQKKGNSKKLALDMISKVLSLQKKKPDDSMYGHWPLDLGTNPNSAKPNELPVELMGCLLILFYEKYQHELPDSVRDDCQSAISHIYKSGLYRQPIIEMYHHDAKHTSLKLLFGHLFSDNELKKQGLEWAKFQLNHIRKFGFKEYGILPWHWHWIQSFTCVWEIIEDPVVQEVISDMLNYLWQLRADYYLKGTWVGAHSRQWPHDSPMDNNTFHDYIQFGDFPMPKEITRLEGACFYSYQVAEDILKKAINPKEPVEIKRKIQFAKADGLVSEEVHTYLFKTSDYAVGGVWERVREYDNEQRRWDISLPLTKTNAQKSVNQAFFFHPGEKFTPGDDRHESPYGEVMFHKATVIQLWNIPLEEEDIQQNIIGCLPLGEWKFENYCGYGRVENIYLTFKLLNEIEMVERKDRISIKSPITAGWNGVILEAVSCKDAAGAGVNNLESFAAAIKEKNNSSFTVVNKNLGQKEHKSVSYTTWENDTLHFTLDKLNNSERIINNQHHSLSDYEIG